MHWLVQEQTSPEGHSSFGQFESQQPPLAQLWPVGQVTPKQAAWMHAPLLQTPPSQDVEPQEVGSHCPCAQRYPDGQSTPKQSGVTQLPS
jgi:hypothetical protein